MKIWQVNLKWNLDCIVHLTNADISLTEHHYSAPFEITHVDTSTHTLTEIRTPPYTVYSQTLLVSTWVSKYSSLCPYLMQYHDQVHVWWTSLGL